MRIRAVHRIAVIVAALMTSALLGACAQEATPGESGPLATTDEHGCPSQEMVDRYASIGPTGLCGGCDPTCRLTPDIPDDDDFADYDEVWGESTAYVPEKGGVVIVPPGVRVTSQYAWLANTSVSTVTKVHLQTYTAQGVYRVGLQSVGVSANYPSRTTVDILGCSYVAQRAFGRQGSVTKLAGEVEDCADLNGNGVIDTSTGLNDIRGWPGTVDQDECVLWNVPVGPSGGTPRALTIDALGRIWVGLYNTQQFIVLDSVDGHVISTVNIDLSPYGAAVAADGLLWTSTLGRAIQSINTYTTIPTDADVGVVRTPPANAYGMAVDGNSDVYLSNRSDGGYQRYNVATDTFDLIPNSGSGSSGVVVDELGNVFTGDRGDHAVSQYNATAQTDVFDVGAWGGLNPKGVCPDFYGRVWAANQGSANVSVIELGVGVVGTIPVQSWNYTYSDFTGYGLATFAAMVGYVFRDYDSALACGGRSLRARVYYNASFPNPGALQFHGRSSDSEAGLETAPETWLGSVDTESGSVPILGPMDEEEASRRYFRLRISLLRGGEESPILHDYTVEEYCL